MEMSPIGNWLSILEYARYKSVSISTIRRAIKSKRIKYKLENGKYLIFVGNYTPHQIESSTGENSELLRMQLENERLLKLVMNLQEQVDELQMLVSIYEREKTSQMANNELPPELPFNLKA